MSEAKENTVTRGQIAVRLLYTLLFLVVFEIVKGIVFLTILFQYVCLLVTMKHSEPVRTFTNKVITYAYRISRYMTLNETPRPFPFAEFPGEMELPEEEVTFP